MVPLQPRLPHFPGRLAAQARTLFTGHRGPCRTWPGMCGNPPVFALTEIAARSRDRELAEHVRDRYCHRRHPSIRRQHSPQARRGRILHVPLTTGETARSATTIEPESAVDDKIRSFARKAGSGCPSCPARLPRSGLRVRPLSRLRSSVQQRAHRPAVPAGAGAGLEATTRPGARL
jgi:hypothetical protein